MSTKIEWTDETWNPIRGCSLVSDGCKHCYAMKQAHRFSGPGGKYEGLTELGPDGPRWTGRVRVVPELLDLPLRWKKPRMIFVNSMSDLFHADVPDEFIGRVFSVMALTRQHTFQILTKRPARMLDLLRRWPLSYGFPYGYGQPPVNVWLGVSVENQKTADERIPLLLQTPAAVRWVSAEPLLGPIRLKPDWIIDRSKCEDCRGTNYYGDNGPGIRGNREYQPCDNCSCAPLRWVVVGGESGPGARPMHPDWARSLRDQCNAAHVPFFFKQWGAWMPYLFEDFTRGRRVHLDENGRITSMVNVGKKRAGSLLDGREWKEYPQMRGVVDSQVVMSQREKMST